MTQTRRFHLDDMKARVRDGNPYDLKRPEPAFSGRGQHQVSRVLPPFQHGNLARVYIPLAAPGRGHFPIVHDGAYLPASEVRAAQPLHTLIPMQDIDILLRNVLLYVTVR